MTSLKGRSWRRKIPLRQIGGTGTLAAGIAHEINNPLTNASLTIELLKGRLNCCGDKAEEILQKVKEVESNADRAAFIAKELLHFSRQKEIQLEETDVNEVIGAPSVPFNTNSTALRSQKTLPSFQPFMPTLVNSGRSS